MKPIHDQVMPGEDPAYRAARDRLLRAEMELRRQVEELAVLRRSLPLGGPLPEDYRFQEGPRDLDAEGPAKAVSFSELFEDGKTTLLLYNFMYPPAGEPCPMCTAFLDSLNGAAPHLAERVALAVVGKAPIEKLRAWARARGWNHLRLLSSADNGFNAAYHAETPDGAQWPLLHVFRKTPEGIRHWLSSELFFAPREDGMHPRHIDMAWPLWNLLDLTPEGRGEDWYPRGSYQASLEQVKGGGA
jgi:predicted dithiol-disulfide oxidoreductase (DUF899 family)